MSLLPYVTRLGYPPGRDDPHDHQGTDDTGKGKQCRQGSQPMRQRGDDAGGQADGVRRQGVAAAGSVQANASRDMVTPARDMPIMMHAPLL
jgi:hypothetical protein